MVMVAVATSMAAAAGRRVSAQLALTVVTNELQAALSVTGGKAGRGLSMASAACAWGLRNFGIGMVRAFTGMPAANGPVSLFIEASLIFPSDRFAQFNADRSSIQYA